MSTDSSKKTFFWHRWLKDDWGVPGGILASFTVLLAPAFLLQPVVPVLASVLPLTTNTKISLFSILLEILTIALLALVIKAYGRKLADIGFNRPTFLHAGKAALGFGMYFLLTAVLMVLSLTFLPIDHTQAQEIGYRGVGGYELLLAFVALVVLTPLAEEAIFRGFMFRGLRRRLPFWPAALVVSFLFGLVHGQWNVGIDVFALSIVSCYLREESGSLWPSIFLHAIKNSVAFYLLLIYNGL